MAALGTRKLKIEIDAVERTAEVSVCKVTSAASDADFVSFAGAASGGARDYKLVFTAVQDAETTSLWTEVFENAGDTVAVTMMPYGNAVPSATEPHFTMDAVISEPDGDLLGGEADASTSARMVFECEWALEAKPVKVTAP